MKESEGGVMLVKFNKSLAMWTLPLEVTPGKDYEVTISGELKDGRPFEGSTRITITNWKKSHSWKWEDPAWLNSDKDLDNWWNKGKGIEGWWEKLRRTHQGQAVRKRKGG